MTRNRSLEEFVGGEETGESPADAGATAVDETPAEAAAPDAVEPLAETVAWSPEGGACAACGEPAEERWRDGDALVCGDCKDW